MAAQPDRAARVLVVGAREGSLGWWAAEHVRAAGVEAHTAGISDEHHKMNASDVHQTMKVFEEVQPTHLLCTVGANIGSPVYSNQFTDDAFDAMLFNYFYPMNLLNWFIEWLDGMPGTYVGISSNSAHIARTSSAAYCAAKAAYSMGLRCAARDVTRAGKPIRIWGYEPGALAGTPMTNAVRQRIGKDIPMSRMLTDPSGLPTAAVGRIIARDLMGSAEVLHGCMVRLDNGEQ